ncbi:MAG: HigA family addiction module antitoxin [Candidatus Eiseniibacteriota bacterium]
MPDRLRNEYFPEIVSAPGETLLELLGDRGMTQAELAERMGRPKKTVNEIVRGRAELTPETALQLERVLGVLSAFWGNLERNYRDYLARSAERGRLREHSKWPDSFPILQMTRLGFIEPAANRVDYVATLLDFFAVTSVEQWHTRYKGPTAAFRLAKKFQPNIPALAAWLRQGERMAQAIECSDFDEQAFAASLVEVRHLTRVGDAVALQAELPRMCSRRGVAVVFVPELKDSRACGATRWLSPKKAIIQLSLRYKTDDHLWFTFFHEAGHILLHGKRDSFVEGRGVRGDEGKEAEADQFAAEKLIPGTKMTELLALQPFTASKLEAFAKQIDVAPGIVVGRLQHDGHLPFTHLNSLKRHYRWDHEAD